MARDARQTTGGTRSTRGGLWERWWESLTVGDRRRITTSSHPVRVVNGKVVRQARDH